MESGIFAFSIKPCWPTNVWRLKNNPSSLLVSWILIPKYSTALELIFSKSSRILSLPGHGKACCMAVTLLPNTSLGRLAMANPFMFIMMINGYLLAPNLSAISRGQLKTSMSLVSCPVHHQWRTTLEHLPARGYHPALLHSLNLGNPITSPTLPRPIHLASHIARLAVTPLSPATGPYMMRSVTVPTFWKLDLSERIKVFIWKCAKGILAVKSGLAISIHRLPTTCPLCEYADETMERLFCKCPLSQAVWNSSQFPFSIIPTYCWWFHFSRLDYGLDYRGSQLLRPIKENSYNFISILWAIWKNRNQKVFSDSEFSPPEVLAMAADSALWFHRAST